jgi:glycosyltransferase involved in cell wall biosynthesis
MDEFRTLVAAGDTARDSRDPRAAARAYEAALAIRPEDFGIWVQLGHMLKEDGKFGRAEEAYLRAHAIAPNDQDLLIQLGHFFASRGAADRAAEHYQRAVSAGSRDPHALHYLARNPAPLAATQTKSDDPVPAVYLDLSDLIDYFRRSRFPTGIQRMEIELFKASLRWNGAVPIRACAYSQAAENFVDLDPRLFGALCELASVPGSTEDPAWIKAYDAFTENFVVRPAFTPPAGAALINLGPWWHIDYMQVLRDNKAAHGLRYVPFVHDIIPLLLPEELPPGTGAIFASWLSSALAHADHVAVNSDCTRRDLVRVAQSVRPIAEPPVVVPLDAVYTLRGAAPDAPQRRAIVSGLGVGEDFVLFVGTLEARKDHLLVFRAWKRLLDSEPAENVPPLICVGRHGWAFGPAQAYLDAHPELAEKVLILSGISDLEMHALYSECRFTLFASTYEGWGLPVTEALCHGKVCLTANHSSLPEAGGKFAVYYEPESASSFYTKLRELMFDDALREERERLIAEEYRPRSWSEVLAGLVNGVLPHLRTLPLTLTVAAPVEAGTIYKTNDDRKIAKVTNARAVVDMLRQGRSWHNFDDQRLWSMRPESVLSFWAPQPVADADLLVTLRVRCPPEPQTLTIKQATSVLARLPLKEDETRNVRLVLPRNVVARLAGGGRPVVLRLLVDRLVDMQKYDETDQRQAGIGLEMFSACWASDTISRLGLLEHCLSTWDAGPKPPPRIKPE